MGAVGKVRRAATDWDDYYLRPPRLARFTRRYTARRLVAALRAHSSVAEGLTVAEFGGANSSFLAPLSRAFRIKEYHVIDTNELGLQRAGSLRAHVGNLVLWKSDARAFREPLGTDVSFSVGFVEHFDCEGTRQALSAHFAATRPGGLVLVSFPTPTWLYRGARVCVEAAGAWRFGDERPLWPGEVLAFTAARGRLLHDELLWPLVFTQRLMAIRKTGC